MRYGGTPELSVVIPTVDALSRRVRECIDAVRQHTDSEHEILVIENRAPPQGYTAPVNAGIRGAQGNYIVVVNDDIRVTADWWPPLRRALDDGALVSFPDYGEFPRSDFFAAPVLALSREALALCSHSAADFLDPSMKVWFQDLDLLVRLCEIKRPPVPVRESGFEGKWATTIKSLDDPKLAAWVREAIEHDQRVFGEKWSGGRRGPRVRAILAPYMQSDEAAAATAPGEPEQAG
jgi:glycosyltransferase involved in cell wall biosynthesis